jgi:hypothetical protein
MHYTEHKSILSAWLSLFISFISFCQISLQQSYCFVLARQFKVLSVIFYLLIFVPLFLFTFLLFMLGIYLAFFLPSVSFSSFPLTFLLLSFCPLLPCPFSYFLSQFISFTPQWLPSFLTLLYNINALCNKYFINVSFQGQLDRTQQQWQATRVQPDFRIWVSYLENGLNGWQFSQTNHSRRRQNDFRLVIWSAAIRRPTAAAENSRSL